MKAVVLHEYGGPDKLAYEEVAMPSPKDGEVVVKVAAAGINPIDWKLRSGAMKAMMPLTFPAILGADVAGTLVVGGQRVMGMLPAGAYAEYVVAKRADLVAIPSELDEVQAAALPMVLLTGAEFILEAVRPEKGWTVLVAGALGGVGRSAIYVAKQEGATVIAGVRKKQLEKAKELGADQVIAIDDDAALAALAEVDAVFDAVGGDVAEKLVQKVKSTGVWATAVGAAMDAAKARGIRAEGLHAHPDADLLERLVKDVAAGKLVIPVERTFPLAEASQAHALAERGGVAKLILKP